MESTIDTKPYTKSTLKATAREGARKRHGRAYRRRRQKLLEIEQAEELLLQQMNEPSIIGAAVATKSATATATIENSPVTDASDLSTTTRRHGTMAPQHELSLYDKACLTAQLGYVPENAIRVTCRLGQVDLPGLHLTETNQQEPVAIQLYPLAVRTPTPECKTHVSKGTRKQRIRKRHASELNPLLDAEETAVTDAAAVTTTGHAHSTENEQLLLEPFPTMFWLTHPLLRIMISKLEVSGMGSQLEKRLQGEAIDDGLADSKSAETVPPPQLQDSSLYLDQMKRAHASYGRERFCLLTLSDIDLLRDRNWTGALDESRGVAGIALPSAVKCLHAHAAHFVSRPKDENVVGLWVMQEITRVLREKQQTTAVKSIVAVES